MTQARKLLVVFSVAALAAAAPFAVAQPPPGGPGGGPGGGRGFGRGGRPFEVGTIAAISEDATTLTLTSEIPQAPNATVVLNDQTVYYTAWDVEAADVAVGDVVALRGTPLRIQADQVQVGADLQALFGFGGPGPNAPGAQPQAGAPPAAPMPMLFGMVNGTVVQTEPLTVDVNGLQVEVTLSEGATLTKIAPMDQPEVAIGDRVITAGQRAEAQGAVPGVLTASVVLVDITANGVQLFRGGRGGPGGFGGGRGGPGGGPGGPPPANP